LRDGTGKKKHELKIIMIKLVVKKLKDDEIIKKNKLLKIISNKTNIN
jgi:hypothetical protein